MNIPGLSTEEVGSPREQVYLKGNRYRYLYLKRRFLFGVEVTTSLTVSLFPVSIPSDVLLSLPSAGSRHDYDLDDHL